jgi:hypothetical protein
MKEDNNQDVARVLEIANTIVNQESLGELSSDALLIAASNIWTAQVLLDITEARAWTRKA